jgi:hypothetical protein
VFSDDDFDRVSIARKLHRLKELPQKHQLIESASSKISQGQTQSELGSTLTTEPIQKDRRVELTADPPCTLLYLATIRTIRFVKKNERMKL